MRSLIERSCYRTPYRTWRHNLNKKSRTQEDVWSSEIWRRVVWKEMEAAGVFGSIYQSSRRHIPEYRLENPRSRRVFVVWTRSPRRHKYCTDITDILSQFYGVAIDGFCLPDRIYWTPYTLLRSTFNYSSIADLHTLQFTVTQCSQSSLVLSWQRIYNGLTVTAAHMKSSFDCLSFLLIIRLPSPETLSVVLTTNTTLFETALLITFLHEQHRKHCFITIPLLLERCIYLAIFIFLRACTFQREPVYWRCLAKNYSCFQASCHNFLC
jgi:hypothetical protein